jgi:hypothetical protein
LRMGHPRRSLSGRTMRDIMEVSLNSRYIKAADVVAIVEVAKIVRRRLRHSAAEIRLAEMVPLAKKLGQLVTRQGQQTIQRHCDLAHDSRLKRLGAARIICVPLAPTVNRPLQAQLLRPQWRKWHKSLALERPLSSPKGAAYRAQS